MSKWYWSVTLITLVMLLPTLPTHGQALRSPELNLQYHRAETAWRNGTSMLEAKARVDRVLKALPDDVEARKLRAKVLLAMHRHQDALVDANRAVALDSDDGEAYLILCEAARLSGDMQRADEALDAAAERVGDHAALHLRLSWNAVELGELDEAEAFARIALALDEQEATSYYQLARVFILKGQQDDAATILARGLKEAILDAATIEKDKTLAHIIGHATLAPWIKP